MRNSNNIKFQNNKIFLTQYANSLAKKNLKQSFNVSSSRTDSKFNMLHLLMNDINERLNKKSIKKSLKQSVSNENINTSKQRINIKLNLINGTTNTKKTKTNKKNKKLEESIFKLEKSLKSNQTKIYNNSFLIPKESLINKIQKRNNKNALSFDNLLDTNNKTKYNNYIHSSNSAKKINSFRVLQSNSNNEKKFNIHPILSSNNNNLSSRAKKIIMPKHSYYTTQYFNSEKSPKFKKKISISLKKRNIEKDNVIERNKSFNNLVSKCEQLKEKTNKILSNFLNIVEKKFEKN